MSKGSSKQFKRGYSMLAVFFRSSSGGKTVRGFLISLLLPEVKPRKIFRIKLFSSKDSALCDKEMTLQNGHFCSFVGQGKGLDPQIPPS